MGTLTRQTGTLTRYHKDNDHLYYGPMKNLQESDRDLSSSSPVLLEMYDHVKVTADTNFQFYKLWKCLSYHSTLEPGFQHNYSSDILGSS